MASDTNTTDGSNMNETIEWEIANLDALKHFEPKVCDIGGIDCKIGARIEGKELALYCVDIPNYAGDFYIFETAIHLELKEKGKETTLVKDWGRQYWMNDCSWDLVTDVTQIKTGAFPKILYLHIAVIWRPCEGSLPIADALLRFLAAQRGVKYPAIPVNRHILAGHSAYFRKFFFGPWNDEEEEPIPTNGDDGLPVYEITDVFDPTEFFYMMLCGVQLLGVKVCELNCLQAIRAEKRVDRCMAMLRTAVKYEMPIWVQYGQKLLISAGPGTMAALELAESLKLSALKEHCLKTLDTLDYVKCFDANQRIYGRLSEQARLLVNARLKTNACRYSRKRKRLDVQEDNDDDEK